MGRTLFIGNISKCTTPEGLREIFSEYGTVEEVYVLDERGIGFVRMSSSDEAEAAISELNMTFIEGNEIRVEEEHSSEKRDRRDYISRYRF